MTQIKVFINANHEANAHEKLEKHVNDFLKENEDKIIVKDIKYSVTEGNFGNPIWKNWMVMVIYENR